MALEIRRPLPGNLRTGDHPAEEFLPEIYLMLCHRAESQMHNEPADPTLDSVGLLHEAWTRVTSRRDHGWINPAQLVAALTTGMRHVLVDRARYRHALRHGGGLRDASSEVPLHEIECPTLTHTLGALRDALGDLARRDVRKAELINRHFFAGLTLQQTANAMRISERTARREWEHARIWLRNELLRART